MIPEPCYPQPPVTDIFYDNIRLMISFADRDETIILKIIYTVSEKKQPVIFCYTIFFTFTSLFCE